MITKFSGLPVSLAICRLVLASSLCCCSWVQAQQTGPGVSVYGLADIGLTRVTGLRAGSVMQLASGIMEGSRWGIKGNEDLGGGYRAVFALETRVEFDTGASSNRPISGSQLSDRFSNVGLLGLPTDAQFRAASGGLPLAAFPDGTIQGLVSGVDALLANEFGVNVGQDGNRLFDRQAYIGLVTSSGALLAGRQYTPAYETFGTFDSMATQSALSAGQVVQFPAMFEIRNANALAYRIATDSLSASIMYAPGESAVCGDCGQLLGFNARYKTDTFTVGFGYNSKNNELGDKALTSSVLGAAMNAGRGTLSAMVVKMADDNPNGLSAITGLLTPQLTAAGLGAQEAQTAAALVQSRFIEAFKQDGTLFHMGYRFVDGPRTITLAYSSYNDNRPNDADVSSYGMAYTYALSKHTDLNAVLVRFDNKNLAQMAPGGTGYLGGVTASAGTDSTGLALGLRHRF